jgi:hypothetical protein
MGEEHGLQAPPALDDLGPVPPLLERVRGVVLAPGPTFARHDAAWGWAGPFALVALAGVLFGLVFMARVDITAVQRAAAERAQDQLDAATKRRMDDPKVKEFFETSLRFTAFGTKVWLVVGPPVGGLVGLLGVGAACFAASSLLHRRHPTAPRPDLMRSISLAAHVSLVNLIGLGALTLGALTGNPQPTTSAANLADPFTSPVLATVLGRVDPVTVLYYVVLAAGLEGSLRFPRRLAVGLAAGTYLGVSALQLLAAGASIAAQQLGAGGGGA